MIHCNEVQSNEYVYFYNQDGNYTESVYIYFYTQIMYYPPGTLTRRISVLLQTVWQEVVYVYFYNQDGYYTESVYIYTHIMYGILSPWNSDTQNISVSTDYRQCGRKW